MALAFIAGPGAAGTWAEDFIVTKLDGSSVTGELLRWTDGELTIETPAGAQTLAHDTLLSIRRPLANPLSASSTGMLELTDDTRLPIADFQSDGREVKATLRGVTEEPLEVTVPAQRVSAVWWQPLTTALSQQWLEIQEQNLPGDVLVVIQNEGQSLDHVEGVVDAVSPTRVSFKLDGQAMSVDRAKAAGVIYFRRPGGGNNNEDGFVLRGAHGLRANIRRVQWEDGALLATTVAGVALKIPTSAIESADFSAGKVMYLSDIEGAVENWTPLVGLPSGASLAADYARPRRDRSAFGGPLRLLSPAADESTAPVASAPYSKGLALRSRSEITYRLPSGFNRLLSVAGFEPESKSNGEIQLTIRGDDRTLLEATLRGTDEPLAIDLDVAGVRRLTVLADFGDALNTGDWLNLCDARLTK